VFVCLFVNSADDVKKGKKSRGLVWFSGVAEFRIRTFLCLVVS
jgi:hypothetical protein